MDEKDIINSESAAEPEGMSKFKSAFLKALPLIIVLSSIAIFGLLIKWVAGMFYTPVDTHYVKMDGETKYNIVHCYQNPSNTYYIYGADYIFDEESFKNVGNEHESAHADDELIVFFTLNESALDIEKTTLKKLIDGNGLLAYQFGEFVLYRLEGQLGVFAPLRDYETSATKRKNDLYVIRQMMKNDNYKQYILPDGTSYEQFFAMLEKIEWYLDTEYIEDN